MLARSLPRALGATAFTALLGIALVLPASAAPEKLDEVSAAQLETLMSTEGLSVAAAKQRLAHEAVATDVVSTLEAALGSSYAGAWFAPGATDLTVATTDPAAAQRIRAAGALPKLVSLDLLTLNRVMTVLDSRASSVSDAVTGWYVDPISNSVVVSATDPASAETFAAGLEGVRIEQVDTRPVQFADLLGGDGIDAMNDGSRCSIGFNATSGGTRYIITAGHCTKVGGKWKATDGTEIGRVAQSSFPTNDFGIIEVTSPSWRQTPSVKTSNGRVTMTGTAQSQVGASICRSGATTGYRCGTVEALNESVNYGNGDIVHGLTRTSACAQPGDSGGPFVSGSLAHGTLSGGVRGCGVNVLGAPSTYFQPIGEALSTYNLTLLTG
ncbi:MAG: S1 family peptidase [Pseudonocardiaceae bacterium]